MLGQYSVNKLNMTEADALEGALTENELGNALNNMKHNKTPGIDGFPSEFYKLFWKYLKSCVLRALNDSMDRGKLPLSLHQCVITCLPKKGKIAVGRQFTVQNPNELYVLVSSALPTTRRDMTCTVLKAT